MGKSIGRGIREFKGAIARRRAEPPAAPPAAARPAPARGRAGRAGRGDRRGRRRRRRPRGRRGPGRHARRARRRPDAGSSAPALRDGPPRGPPPASGGARRAAQRRRPPRRAPQPAHRLGASRWWWPSRSLTRFHEQLIDAPRAAAARSATRTTGLITLSPTEPFFTTLKVCFWAAILLSLPVWLYQLYAFVIPAVQDQSRRRMLLIVAGASALFLGGRGLRLLRGAAGRPAASCSTSAATPS